MKRKTLVVVALLLVTLVSLSSCKLINGAVDFVNGIINPETDIEAAPLSVSKIIDFANGANPDVLFESDGWSNGDVFNVVWKKNNVVYENGIMRLGITEEKATAWLNDAEVEFKYTAGEARTQNYYHYGDYAVSMKPSANPGTASTFFTCTGNYDTKYLLDETGDYLLDENGQRIGQPNPHDEIDIEFLGKDTTHVQFNFFVDGKGGNEYMHDLGFDASEDFHIYGYRWTETSITWFVDGEPVYMVTTDTSVKEAGNVRIVEKIPQTPGRILTNYWCGNERAVGWMGLYTGATKDQGTEYQWIATSAQGAPLNPPEKPNEEVAGLDWSKIEAIAPSFESTELYTVETEGTSATISYTEVGGSCYKNVEMDITEASKGKNYLHLLVTNNGTADVRFRVNVVDMALVEAGAQNMSTNDSATVNGDTAWTDHEWGGSFFDLKAGETYEIVIVFKGEVEKLQLMPDSSKNDSSVNAGNITISEIKFTTVGEVEIPEEKPEDKPVDPSDKPETPTSGNLTLDFGEFSTTIGGNVSDGYGVNVEENNVIDVVYTNIVGDSYKNIWANVAAIAGRATTFSVKVKNYGDAPVKVRIDIESQTKTSPNTTCCNVSATQDGNGVYTDTEWGGSMFEIAAGATATLEVVYDPSKLPTNVKIMIDSSTYQDSATYAGHVEFFELNFSGEHTPADPTPDPDPTPNPDELEASGEYVKFVGNDCYTITADAEYSNIFKVDYANVSDNSYQNINAYIADKAEGKTTLGLIIANNGSETVSITVKLETAASSALGEYKMVIAAGETQTLSGNFTGEAAMLYLFIASGWCETTDVHSGSITLTGITFSGEVSSEPAPTYDYKDLYVEFKTENAYTITTTDTYVNSARVAYTDMAKNSWANINIWVEDKSADCSVFSMKLTNHGAATVSVWVQMKDANGAELINQNVDIEAGAENVVTFEYTGTAQMIFFFVDSTHEADADLNTGDITISEIKLGKVVAAE